MAFTLRVVFSGICGFVPDQAWEKPKKIRKICAVLIDGRDPTAVVRPSFEKNPLVGVALDGKRDLERHTGIVQFNLKDLQDQNDRQDSIQGVWRLDRERLTFRFVHEEPTGRSLEVDGAELDAALFPDEDNQGSLQWVADMTKIMPRGHGKIDPRALEMSPPSLQQLKKMKENSRFPVLAQVILDHGTLATHGWREPLGDTALWSFEASDNDHNKTIFGTTVQNRSLAHQVALTVSGLRSFELVSTPFDKKTKPPPPLVFSPGKKQKVVEIRMVNFCDHNPLAWELPGGGGLAATEDRDFKWFFEYLPDRTRKVIAKAVQGCRELPFPLFAGPDNGLGDNCRKSRFFHDRRVRNLPDNVVEPRPSRDS